MEFEDDPITPEQIETLDGLLDPWERTPIATDEDYQKLGETFDENE